MTCFFIWLPGGLELMYAISMAFITLLAQRAVECYRRAATAGDGGGGHPDAWYNLGTIYYEGGPGKSEGGVVCVFKRSEQTPPWQQQQRPRPPPPKKTTTTGVPRDVPMAVECFTAAAASPLETSGSAAYWLGHLYRLGDEEGGACVLCPCVEKKGGGGALDVWMDQHQHPRLSPTTQYVHVSTQGVRPDREKALRFLREACEQKEHPAACYYLVRACGGGGRHVD